jgi:glycosyltransferase involved in cell wall biosynthesis
MLPTIIAIIPAYNEEGSVGLVVQAIPKDWVHTVIVVNNNSSDQTAAAAQAAGALVLHENRQGYGYACLKGIEKATELGAEILVFLDADLSDHPEQLPQLLQPILYEGIDLVIGSRVLGKLERGALTPQQRFGNWLATTLLRWGYSVRYTDLGPFRAIRLKALQQLQMEDKTYGWTMEMQAKAARLNLAYREIPVDYRPRIAGQSKVSGTLKGSILAGYKIILTLLRYWRWKPSKP